MSQQSLIDDGRIVEVDIADRMEQAFLDYSMSVIVGRALPDVRDGLKPVQRRILFAMDEAGLRPDRQHRKCAAVLGDVMKKYHPHGDSAIYDALVRMAQDFSMRDPLVDGRGNFGSIDGDPPAAHRYTECRLTPLAMELLAGIDEDTVDFQPNYDGFEREPVVLPARFPNLLVNGASGIAVGMATNIPPHNLGEVVDACLHLLANPDADLDELLEIVPAPDFPTGGRIVPGEGIREAYATGRGAITVEAVASTEVRSGGLPRIVVTEIPYQVNKAALLQKIADLVRNRKLEAIRDIRDESSRDGMRAVFELKRGEDPAKVLEQLYRLTELRTNFNANIVALVDGQPQTLGLRDALTHYLAHQREVLTRRTRHRRDKAAERAHVLEGLLVALDHLDEVIALIRAADSAAVAREQLMDRFAMTEVQATAVLDMMLRRLARLEREKLAAEHRELVALIAELDAILADPARLDALLAEELTAVRDAHATPRRSRIAGVAAAGQEAGTTAATAAATLTLEAQPVTVYVTRDGLVKPVAQQATSRPHDGVRDPVVAVVRGLATDTLLLIDAEGMGYRISLADLAVGSMRQRGTPVAALLGEAPAAPLAGAVRLGDHATVMTVSAAGLVKRTAAEEYTGRLRTMIAAGVRDDDRLVAVLGVDDTDEVLLAHSGGQVIRFPAEDVRPMGRAAAGVAGLQVPAAAAVVAATTTAGGDHVVTVAADGRAKRTPLDDYPRQGRGGKGVLAGAKPVAFVGVAQALHVPTADGWVVTRAETLQVLARPATPPAVLPAVVGGVVAETVPASG